MFEVGKRYRIFMADAFEDSSGFIYGTDSIVKEVIEVDGPLIKVFNEGIDNAPEIINTHSVLFRSAEEQK